MIAITVSTNYSDLLPLVLENARFFKHWIFVTDHEDLETRKILEGRKNTTVLFYDFQSGGRKFDKGGAVRMAQLYAYEIFPEDWYLLLDSDILLGPNTFNVVGPLSELDPECLYGSSHRHNYRTLEDLRMLRNCMSNYIPGNQIWGFFQLYKKKVTYQTSDDCSGCDIVFGSNFRTHKQLPLPCFHLGQEGVNWKGRLLGSDFTV